MYKNNSTITQIKEQNTTERKFIQIVKKEQKRIIRIPANHLKNFVPLALYFFQQAGTELCSVPCLESLDLS